MSRLQSKCMLASAAVHLLLLALLIVSSAFVKPPPPPEKVHFIKVFNAKLTDEETTGGGGNPDAGPPAQAIEPVAAPVQPAPTLIQPTPAPLPATPPPEAKKPTPDPEPPKPRETKPLPEPVKPKPKITPKPKVAAKPEEKKEPEKKEPEPKPKPKPEPAKPRHVIVPDLTTRKVASVDPEIQRKKIQQAEKARREAEERAEAEEREQTRAYNASVAAANAQARRIADARRAAVEGAVGNITSGISGSTLVEMPGPGGEAFVNYSEYIWSKYYAAWRTPEERGGASSVRVEIVVARDGRVISADIIKRSGDAALDKSVRDALDRVRTLPAFPEGARDLTRTFKINFTLKAKRQLG